MRILRLVTVGTDAHFGWLEDLDSFAAFFEALATPSKSMRQSCLRLGSFLRCLYLTCKATDSAFRGQ